VRLKELIVDTLNSCNGLTATTGVEFEGETIAVDVASADGADESGSVTAVRTKSTDAEGDEDGASVM
jgi:hypothetical protein